MSDRVKIQQGDVILVPVDGVRGKKHTDNILAHGEATGHAHRLQSGTVYVDTDGTMTLECDEQTTVTHEEHGSVTLAPGAWEVRRVREYDHFAEEARVVAD